MEFKKIIKSDYTIVIMSSMFHAGVLFLYGVFSRYKIPPVQFGLYSTASLILNYLNYVQLGVVNSYNRDYPQAVGSGDREKSASLRNTTFWYLLILYSLVGLIISLIALSLMEKQLIERDLAFGIILICVIALLANISSFSTSTLKAEGRFSFSATVIIISTLVQAVVGCLFISLIGYYGLYIGLITYSVTSLCLTCGLIKHIKLQFDKQLLKNLLLYGIPLLVNSFVWTITMSTDQLVTLYFSTIENLGIYSVAQMAFSVMMLVPQSISQVLYVKLSNGYGKEQDIPTLLSKTERYTQLISFFSSVFVVAVIFIVPFFVETFMPKYTGGIIPAQILCVGVAFYGTTMLYGNVFSVLKENKRLFLSTLVLCISNIVLSVGFVTILGFSLIYVAIGTSTSYAIYSLVMVWILSKRYKRSFFQIIKKTWGPVLVSMLPNVVVYFLLPNSLMKVIWSFLMCIIDILLFLLIRMKRND